MIMKGFLSDRLRHRMRGAGGAQRLGDLATGAGLPARDGAGELIHAPVEAGHAAQVEPDIGAIAAVAMQERRDRLDRKRGIVGWPLLACFRVDLKDPAAGVELPCLRQLHGHNPGTAPDNAAAPDRRVEYRV
jgi:hypothetical protein